MDAEAFHHSVRTRYGAIGHHPHQHVGRLRKHRHEIPKRRMSGLRLRYLAVGFRLCCVDEVGELDPIANEEHGDVVTNEVEYSFTGVELDRETPDIANGV